MTRTCMYCAQTSSCLHLETRKRKPRRRRGSFLIEVLFIIPLVAAITTVGFQLTTRIIRFQGQVSRQFAQQAKMDDLVRRIQLDAGSAASAVIDGETLKFPEVAYRVDGQNVIRTDTSNPEQGVSYHWTFERMNIRFTIEKVDDSPRLVWLTFRVKGNQRDVADLSRRFCSAAAKIGRRGAL